MDILLSKTRMGIFNSLYSLIGDFSGKSFLDVFGGSGIMGLEAISRGFSKVKVYEINSKSAEIIKNNYKSLGLEADLSIGDSLKLIQQNSDFYDVVYIDPPYKSGLYDLILPYVNGNIIVVESSDDIKIGERELIKRKKYGSSIITFLR